MKKIIEKNGKKYFRTSRGGLLPYKEKRVPIIGIYCITDLCNGKKYVGSSKDVQNRVVKYSAKSKANGVLRDIVDIKNIEIEILEVLDHSECLLERELYWIKKLNTIYPIGYNKKMPTTNKFFHPECYVKRSSLVKPTEENISAGLRKGNKSKYTWRKGKVNLLP